MSYPNFKNKHQEQSLFTPKNYVNWIKHLKNDCKTTLPKKYILMYYPKLLNYFIKKYKPQKIVLHRLITVYLYKNLGIVCMTGIGSPHATIIFEELIALGGKEFLNIGLAGGLQDFGVFLCEKSIRDEGTSLHYAPHEKFAYPNKDLTQKLENYLKKNSLFFQKALSWTIDAPYRETIAEIKKYKKQNVATVEMESSALFVVAKLRKVRIAAAFVVSDVLGSEKWEPQFNAKHVYQKLNKVFDIALCCLLER